MIHPEVAGNAKPVVKIESPRTARAIHADRIALEDLEMGIFHLDASLESILRAEAVHSTRAIQEIRKPRIYVKCPDGKQLRKPLILRIKMVSQAWQSEPVQLDKIRTG